MMPMKVLVVVVVVIPPLNVVSVFVVDVVVNPLSSSGCRS